MNTADSTLRIIIEPVLHRHPGLHLRQLITAGVNLRPEQILRLLNFTLDSEPLHAFLLLLQDHWCAFVEWRLRLEFVQVH